MDLDRIAQAAARRRWFSHNRFNLMALHDRDHRPDDGRPLRPWIDQVLADSGIDLCGGRVQLLCYPRVLGYVFNPLTLWFCRDHRGQLLAVLAEVHNTFGKRHGYLLHDDGHSLHAPVCVRHLKTFYVSPFLPLTGEYRFRIHPPGEHLNVTIHHHRRIDGPATLCAVQRGTHRPATDAAIARQVLRTPWMTFRVTTAIHWQARFDERFRRMWRYYLAYCEAGFRCGRVDLQRLVLERAAP